MSKWEMVRLGKIFYHIRNGASIKQGVLNHGIPITRIETISKCVIDRDKMGYAGITDNKYSEYYLEDGDILMSHINSEKHLGKVALYTKKIESEKIIHGMNLLCLKTKQNCSKYLFYAFNSVLFKNQLPAITKKSVNQASFNISALKELQIPLPPLDVQEKIADELDKITGLIAKRKMQIAKLDLLVKAKFVEMFGDPVTNPMGWESSKFSYATINYDKLRKPIKSSDRAMIQGIYPYYGATGIVDYINAYKYDGEYLLISEDGKALEFRNKNIAFLAKDKFWVNNHAHVLKASIKANVLYLCHTINNMDISEYVSGIDQKKLTQESMDNIVILLPPLPLQDKFADYVTKVEDAKVNMQNGLKQLEMLYKERMQEYF